MGILEKLTIEDVRRLAANVVVIPVGSTEPHGNALPYGTDSYQVRHIAEAAVERANEEGGRVLCFPTLPISLNNNFRAFPFACRLEVSTFMAILSDLVNMLSEEGIKRVVIVNGHGGNTDVIRASLRDLCKQAGMFIAMIDYDACVEPGVRDIWEHTSDHAGEEESSFMLAIRPNLVKQDKLENNPVHIPKLEVLNKYPVSFVRPWHLYVPVSAGGDARGASAEKGERFLNSAISGMAELFRELSLAPDTENFPY